MCTGQTNTISGRQDKQSSIVRGKKDKHMEGQMGSGQRLDRTKVTMEKKV